MVPGRALTVLPCEILQVKDCPALKPTVAAMTEVAPAFPEMEKLIVPEADQVVLKLQLIAWGEQMKLPEVYTRWLAGNVLLIGVLIDELWRIVSHMPLRLKSGALGARVVRARAAKDVGIWHM